LCFLFAFKKNATILFSLFFNGLFGFGFSMKEIFYIFSGKSDDFDALMIFFIKNSPDIRS